MIEIAILLLLAKLQSHFSNTAAWIWALGFTVLFVLLAWGLGTPVMPLGSVMSFLIVWGYFLLLRRVQDSVWLWFAVYLLIPLALFGIAIAWVR